MGADYTIYQQSPVGFGELSWAMEEEMPWDCQCPFLGVLPCFTVKPKWLSGIFGRGAGCQYFHRKEFPTRVTLLDFALEIIKFEGGNKPDCVGTHSLFLYVLNFMEVGSSFVSMLER